MDEANSSGAPQKKRPGVTRRGFVVGTAGACAMVALGGVSLLPREDVCRPPGAQESAQFLGACIRCSKCIEACPNGVIVPSHIEDGIVSVRTPKINYSRTSMQLGDKWGWCDHCEETNDGRARCVAVCPSGALDAGLDSDFHTMVLGKAVIDHDTCLAWRQKNCTICKNACPLDAIVFDEHNRPSVVLDECNGCGACEQACVSLEATSVGEGENARQVDERAVVVRPMSTIERMLAEGELS